MKEGIVVRLRLFGFGNRPSRFRSQTVTLSEGATVGTLLAWWRQAERVVLSDHLLVIVNGQDARQLQGELTPLSDGDEVTLMLPVAGGAGALEPAASAQAGAGKGRL